MARKNKDHPTAGFTLLEVTISMAIMGILMILFAPNGEANIKSGIVRGIIVANQINVASGVTVYFEDIEAVITPF